MTPRMSALDPAGPQAREIAALWDRFLYVAVGVWVLVVGFTIAAALRTRRRADLVTAPDDRPHARAILLAAIATAATVIGLLVTSILASGRLARLENDPHAIEIQVTGNQWWWEVQYWPEDPRKNATTANEIHVPVGRTIHLALTSNDVIHSFWVPSLHGKRDLVPGRVNRTWFVADEPGIYRGQCAEFCGLQHANMALTIIAELPADFERWHAAQRTSAALPRTTEESRGQRIFAGGPCVLCHTVSGHGAGGRLGPDLTHFASRATIGATWIPNTPHNLRAWMRDPHGMKPGVRMPAIELSSEDTAALLSYVESLR